MTNKPTPITLANDPLARSLIAPGPDLRQVSRPCWRGGSDLSKVVKVSICLADMAHFPKILEARKCWLTPPYPADTTLEVKGLALPEPMVEIDVIASV